MHLDSSAIGESSEVYNRLALWCTDLTSGYADADCLKRHGFFVGMEYINRIVRPTQLRCVPAAINSVDCVEHPFTG